MFKPSTDSASLVVPIQKKIFQFWVWGSLGGASQVGFFRGFMAYFTRPWTSIEWAHVLAQIFIMPQKTKSSQKSYPQER